MKYTIKSGETYELEANNRLDLLEAIIKKENIEISVKKESKETVGKFVFLSQRDPKWAYVAIGKSSEILKNQGCTITCLSMFSYWFGKYFTPDWIAKNLQFTPTGKVYWASMNGKLPMNFVWRYYARNDQKILEILNSKDGVCLLEVNNKKHWVALIGYSQSRGFKVADPYYGDACYLFERYPNITGFTHLTRK